ncbi:MAG TPA: hypothetical protein VEJ41_06810 [Candidatus Acidoferrales bacterium]|nr:hypothetical protein [Candidatus Acidoferrales bacterium]
MPTLLSHVLVAFTIEFDNEAERRLPHRTTSQRVAARRSAGGPWLVSLVMYANLMQFVQEDGVRVADLQRLARVQNLSLEGMRRWGYITLDGSREKKRVAQETVVRPTEAGRRAQQICRPLAAHVEKRWRAQFGDKAIDDVRSALQALVQRLELALPDYFPVLGYGLRVAAVATWRAGSRPSGFAHRDVPLFTLVSQVLLAFTLAYERSADVSLAIGANVLRVLGEDAVRVRDLPRLSGVSKESIKMSVGFLTRRGDAVVESDRETLVPTVRLTPKGVRSKAAYTELVVTVEERWKQRFGAARVRALRNSLERLVGDPADASSPLFERLVLNPDGWRARLPTREVLPHHPMVLHRGGFPDGA